MPSRTLAAVPRQLGTPRARPPCGARQARQALAHRRPQRPRRPAARPRAATSSGSASASPTSTRPLHIADAGVAAIRGGFTRYTAVEGIDELKDAIAAKFRRDNALEYARPQILVSTGAKQTDLQHVLAVIDPGDEAVIPAPYWVSYPDIVLLADGVPVTPYAGPEAGLQDHAGAARGGDHAADAALHPQQPEQPDRRGLHARRARRAGRGAARHPRVLDLHGRHVRAHLLGHRSLLQPADRGPAAVRPHGDGQRRLQELRDDRLADRLLRRAAEIVEAMATIQSQSTSNPTSIAQKAATAALMRRRPASREMNGAFKARHDFFVAGLNAPAGGRAAPGLGTFYAFATSSEAMRGVGAADDNAFAEFLIDEAGVAVVPGSAFGAPGLYPAFVCGGDRNAQGRARPDAARARGREVKKRA